jgi:hypothetical protein
MFFQTLCGNGRASLWQSAVSSEMGKKGLVNKYEIIKE